MSFRRRPIPPLLLAALVALPAALAAQDTGELTISQVRRLALDADQRIVRADLQLRSDGASVAAARAAFGPTVDGSFGLAYLVNPPEVPVIPGSVVGQADDIPLGDDPTNWGLNVGIDVSQALFTWGKLRAGLVVAQAGLAASAAARRQSERDVLRDAELGFASVQASRESLPLLEELANVQLQRLQTVQSQFDAGAAARLAVLEQEALLAGTRLQLVRAEQQTTTAEASLLRLLGSQLDALPALTPWRAGESLPDEAELVEVALETVPAGDEFKALAEQALVQVDLANASRPFRPDIGLSISGALQTASLFEADSFEEWRDAFTSDLTISIGVTVGLFDGGTASSQVVQAETQYNQALSAAADLAESLPLQIRIQVEAYYSAQAALAEAVAREASATEAARVSRVSFENDLVTEAAVLGASIGVLDAQLAAVSARLQMLTALSELRWVTGLDL